MLGKKGRIVMYIGRASLTSPSLLSVRARRRD